jgi:hypothetical protein
MRGFFVGGRLIVHYRDPGKDYARVVSSIAL